MPKRIVFAGTPDFAAVHLKALLEAGFDVAAVYTQQDRKAGRGHKLKASPVKELAAANGIEVYTPLNFKDEKEIEALRALKPDLMIVVAYGIILPQAVLDIPVLGCINVHGSLLPLLRGAAPIQRALLEGFDTTGITIMQMSLGLDCGDMLFTRELKIEADDTSGTLFEKLSAVGSSLLVEKLPLILEGKINPVKQDDSLASYAKKIDKSEAIIDFNTDALKLDLMIRALNPWPVAFFNFKDKAFKVFSAQGIKEEHSFNAGEIVEINKDNVKIACKDGFLYLRTIQEAGRGQVNAGALFKSRKDVFHVGLNLNAKSEAKDQAGS